MTVLKNSTVLTLLAGICAMCIISCAKNSGTVTVEYTKAHPIYADLDEIRSTPLKGELRAIQNPGKIFVSNNVLLIGEEQAGIHVYDNSNAANPVQVGFINIPYNKEFYVEDNAIYAESAYDFLKIDISNLTNPTLADRIIDVFKPNVSSNLIDDVGKFLIGFDYERVTETIDINSNVYRYLEENGFNSYVYQDFQFQLIPPSSVPSSFAGNGLKSGTVNRIALGKEEAFVVSRSAIYVFDNTSSMTHIETRQEGWNQETVYYDNSRIYIGSNNLITIYHVENGNLEYLSNYSHPTACDPVLPNGNVIYSTLRSNGDCPGDVSALLVIDINNITFPRDIMNIEMESPYGLTIIGTKLFVGEGSNGFKVFDISNPTSPELIQTNRDIPAYDIIPHPTDANQLLLSNSDGLVQIVIDNDSYQVLSEIAY